MSITNLQPVLPLETDDNNVFINISDASVNAKQKLKMILLTNKGEKIMNPDFGVGIQKFLFENPNKKISYKYNSLGFLESIDAENLNDLLTSEIQNQVAQYLPDIEITNIATRTEENVLYLSIEYSLSGFLEDSLEISLTG